MKLAWLAILLAFSSCNRAPDAPCRLGHAVDEHPFQARSAVMVFILGNATLYDVEDHRAYGVAVFSEQAQRLLKDLDAKASASKLDLFKSTVSVIGYAYTCSLCGEHKVVVTSMKASDPTKFTDEDHQALRKQLQSWSTPAPALRPECQPPLS